MSQDIVSDGLNEIMNAKKSGSKTVEIKRYSKLLISIMALAKLKNYIEEYRVENKILTVNIGNLNFCKAIKPRFNVEVDEIEKYENRYLPAKDFGMIIISTTKGIMTNQTSKEKNLGGSLIAFMY